MAAPITRMAAAAISGSRRVTNRKTRIEAAPPTAQLERSPAQVLPRFHGRVGPPTVRPTIAAAGSPNAIIAHTAAAIEMYLPENTRIRNRTMAGYATIPASRAEPGSR